jgi:hypothetical protein
MLNILYGVPDSSHLSTSEPTYWPSDWNNLPALVDFCVTKDITQNFTIAKSYFDLSSDHSLVVVMLTTQVQKQGKQPFMCKLIFDLFWLNWGQQNTPTREAARILWISSALNLYMNSTYVTTLFCSSFHTYCLQYDSLTPQVAKHYSLKTYHRGSFKIHLHKCSFHVSGQSQTEMGQTICYSGYFCKLPNSACTGTKLTFFSVFLPQLSHSQLDMHHEMMMGKDRYQCINLVQPSVKTINSYDCSLIT